MRRIHTYNTLEPTAVEALIVPPIAIAMSNWEYDTASDQANGWGFKEGAADNDPQHKEDVQLPEGQDAEQEAKHIDAAATSEATARPAAAAEESKASGWPSSLPTMYIDIAKGLGASVFDANAAMLHDVEYYVNDTSCLQSKGDTRLMKVNGTTLQRVPLWVVKPRVECRPELAGFQDTQRARIIDEYSQTYIDGYEGIVQQIITLSQKADALKDSIIEK